MAKRQLEIPGTERKSIKEIEDSAEHYRSVRDKRMRLTEMEVAAKTDLIQVMVSHEADLEPGEGGTKVYRYDEEIVILKAGKINVKVKAAHDDTPDDDDD